MNANPAQRRYQEWRDRISGHDLDFAILLNRIWDLLRSQAAGPEADEGFWYLICFIKRVRRPQNNLIRNLCQRRHQDYWDTLASRAACLYARLKPQLDILNRRIEQGSQSFYPYLYKVLENNLILCNKEVIDSLWQKGERPLQDLAGEDDGLGDASQYGLLDGNIPMPKTLAEIMDDLHNRERAHELYLRLRDDWPLKYLNALCHYYEVLCGHPTRRLARESNANIDQIHSRLRQKLLAWIADKDFATEEVRLFSALWLPQLCQETPVLETYRDIRDEQNV
ncbi:MAG: hypothetical protein PHD87_07685 [Candidatus Cloacimonetes bacterium]|nr:hypothetical protein [Candidatus Cloacimonadota bacterium]